MSNYRNDIKGFCRVFAYGEIDSRLLSEISDAELVGEDEHVRKSARYYAYRRQREAKRMLEMFCLDGEEK